METSFRSSLIETSWKAALTSSGTPELCLVPPKGPEYWQHGLRVTTCYQIHRFQTILACGQPSKMQAVELGVVASSMSIQLLKRSRQGRKRCVTMVRSENRDEHGSKLGRWCLGMPSQMDCG